MKKNVNSVGSRKWCNNKHNKALVVLVVSPFLMLTWKYFAAPGVLQQYFVSSVGWLAPESAAAWGHFLAGFIILGLVPACIVSGLFRETLGEYGMGLGNFRTLRSMMLLGPCFAMGGCLAAAMPGLRAEYPIDPYAGQSPARFALHAFFCLLFYMGWEFHFRGFLQFGLRGSLGETNAILVQAMASSLLHIGKPATEAFAAVAGGILWGIIAVRSGSILSGLVQHFLLGIMLDLAIVYWYSPYGMG